MPIELGHLLAELSNFGAWGILIGYIIYRDQCDRRERAEQAKVAREIAEKDILSREKLATSLTALSVVISGRPSV